MPEARWTGWARELEQAMRAVAGGAWAEEVTAAWRRHADRSIVEVTLYGPYDADKSTLLKRLLVKDGTTVPAWLTVSARRETFELNEVRSGDLAFTDTPRTAGESAIDGTTAWFLETGGDLRFEATKQLRQELHRAKLIEQSVPLLVELGSLAMAEVQHRFLARAQQERHAKLRTAVQQLATEITDRMLGGERAQGMSWNEV
jgi:hypothetical protein